MSEGIVDSDIFIQNVRLKFCYYRYIPATSQNLAFFSMMHNFPLKSTMIKSTEIFQFGPGKAEKIGFKDVNLNFKVFVIMDYGLIHYD